MPGKNTLKQRSDKAKAAWLSLPDWVRLNSMYMGGINERNDEAARPREGDS